MLHYPSVIVCTSLRVIVQQLDLTELHEKLVVVTIALETVVCIY